jgi:hypothetical protein
MFSPGMDIDVEYFNQGLSKIKPLSRAGKLLLALASTFILLTIVGVVQLSLSLIACFPFTAV